MRKLHRPGGSTLLEVLIAVFVLAIGMLGIAALQAVTLKNSGGSAERTNAVIQSYAMLDVMRANRSVARAGQYNQGWLCQEADIPDDAANANARADVNRWVGNLHAQVGPSACGRIQCGANDCEVEVRWDQSRVTGGTDTPTTMKTTSRL